MSHAHHPLDTPAGPTGLWEATFDVIETGQQVVLDRIDLLRAELRTDMQRALGASALVIAGATTVAAGWVTLMVAAAWALSWVLPPPAAIALIGAGHLLVGLVALGAGVRSVRSLELLNGPTEPLFPEEPLDA